jgi:hypothetical protein
MKPIIAIFSLSLAIACAQKDAGKSLIKLTGTSPAPQIDTPQEATVQAVFDSTLYIGYVDFFPETKEFYTALFYRDGFENPDEEYLATQLDSVIFSDEDWARERLPIEEARKMLVMTGLDTIYIYNRQHHFISKGYFTRVEYLWDGLESYFIAVFKPDINFTAQTEELYAVSSNYAGLDVPGFACQEIDDQQLNKTLLRKLKIDLSLTWDIRHFRIKPTGATYSIVSSYKMDSEEGQSFLTATENNDVSILNKEINDFHYLNILPLPMEVNNKPLLLISAGYPSSDVLWDYLAAFDGKRYEAVDYNRINSRTLMANH